jgi:glutamyl-Q tRNA(Asp) synthetase
VHRLLQQLLSLQQPVYRHHRLIRDATGQKLAKSSRSTGLRELRGEGATPADVRRLIGLAQ